MAGHRSGASLLWCAAAAACNLSPTIHQPLPRSPCYATTASPLLPRSLCAACSRLIALARQHGKDHEASELLFQKA